MGRAQTPAGARRPGLAWPGVDADMAALIAYLRSLKSLPFAGKH